MASVSTGTHFPGCLEDESCRCQVRRYWRVSAIACISASIEATAAHIGESSSLMADAVHLVTHNAVFLIAIFVEYAKIYRWNVEKVKKAGTWGVTGTLVFFVGYVLYDGITRLFDPHLAVGWVVMSVATAGAFANYMQHRELAHAPDKDDILHMSKLHITGDLLISAAVIIGGLVTLITGAMWIDPVLSIGIGCWIAWSVYRLMQSKEAHAHHHDHD